MASIDEHRACSVGQVLDAPFGDSILMVSVDTTERDRLIGTLNRIAKLGAGKNAIVTVVVFDGDMVSGCKTFEGFFCLDRLSSGGRLLGVDVVQTRGVVDKNSSNRMSAIGHFSGTLGNQSGGFGD